MGFQLSIVSHSHWDREWYLSHAEHNYNLVRFMDRLLDVLEKDKKFRSFHLDGQIIILEDYLEVRPEKTELVKKLIAEEKLKIGPFYILQDEYLISGEANIRNILVGLKECAKFGKPTMTGYFPDAFGNIGQMPQILLGFGIDNAFFGRGIVPVGYDNEVVGKADDGYSEITWEGADGSEIIGVQFPGWYNNANEIPSEKEACIARLKAIMANCAKAARTPYLLGMNGCDHQPVQADLSRVLKIAEEAGLNVVHDTLENYISKIRPYRDTFYRFKGEIEGQNGNGFATLINTASSRNYLKQLNYRAEYLLESVAEPLSVIAEKYGIAYDSDILYWIWKKLLQNHPHDSICGCSVDSVHEGMLARFRDATDTANSLIQDLGNRLAKKLCPQDRGIVAVNCSLSEKSGIAECFVDYRGDESVPSDPVVFDDCGNPVLSEIENLGKVKVFELPEDRFRQVYEVTRLKVSFFAEVPASSCAVYHVREREGQVVSGLRAGEMSMENEYVCVRFHQNGTFDLCDKSSGFTVKGQNYYSEVGDKGNEYEFIRAGEKFDTLADKADISFVRRTETEIAIRVENRLKQQNGEYMRIKSIISLSAHDKFVRVKTEFENRWKNHRVRACFACDSKEKSHASAGQFDIVVRPNEPGPRWQNENNPQRTETFVERPYGNNSGAIIAVRGINEYEVDRTNNATELTLVRCIGELGDWFYFPTEGSQCIGDICCEYAVGLYAGGNREQVVAAAYDYSRPPLQVFSARGKKETCMPAVMEAKGDAVVSCLKKAENGKGYICRMFNPFEVEKTVVLDRKAEIVRMDEKNTGKTVEGRVHIAPKQILTLLFD